MRLSRNNISARIEYLKKLIQSIDIGQDRAYEGSIRVTSSNGCQQFYFKSADSKEKYIGKGNSDLIKSVVQREYVEKVRKTAESELITLQILLKKYDRGTVEDIYENLASARRSLVEPVIIPDEEFVRTWLEKPYERGVFEEGDPELLTSRGLRVRSKSEIIIAEKYDEYNIPYKYECPLYLEGFGNARPDFTVLNIRYRRIKYHEHLGKMDDPAYAERNIKKIKAYEDNGFILGRDLIVTFETKNNPINPIDIERVIKNHFL